MINSLVTSCNIHAHLHLPFLLGLLDHQIRFDRINDSLKCYTHLASGYDQVESLGGRKSEKRRLNISHNYIPNHCNTCEHYSKPTITVTLLRI